MFFTSRDREMLEKVHENEDNNELYHKAFHELMYTMIAEIDVLSRKIDAYALTCSTPFPKTKLKRIGKAKKTKTPDKKEGE